MSTTTGAAAAAAVGPTARRIHLQVNEKVTVETLGTIIARISNLTGCVSCGFLGIDLRITGDPVEAKQFQLPGVVSVSQH
jgi:hypothetical protein